MADELQAKYSSLLACAKELCERCDQISCEGINRLAKQCRAELAFLNRLAKKPMKVSQLNSTNLYHLQGIVEAASNLPGVTDILKRFHLPSAQRHVVVDIVCSQGQTWVKVVARNSKALAIDLNGDGEYGSKTLVSQAREYHEAAKFHPHNFAPPLVIFLFSGSVLPDVSAALCAVNVCSESLDSILNGSSGFFPSAVAEIPASLSLTSSDHCSEAAMDRVNLDVTTLISLVSNVCNGYCSVPLSDPILHQQAVEEQASPSLPGIRQFIAGKQLLVCKTALADFRGIVNTVGGPTERQRAETLLVSVTVVPDSLSERALGLPATANMRPRARAVFGTGDQLRAVTTTANVGFVRAASQAGVEFVTFVHPARALTELKQIAVSDLE